MKYSFNKQNTLGKGMNSFISSAMGLIAWQLFSKEEFGIDKSTEDISLNKETKTE